jgi:hypothetical protein
MASDAASQTLSESDLKMFARLSIKPSLLAEARICRVTDSEARGMYGIRFDGDVSGIVFPYPDPASGYRVTARLRRDHPEVDTDGKPQDKYICPWGDNRHLYFPPGAGALLGDVTVPVVIVEAEKSALALTALGDRHGRRLLAIATGGCWSWRGKTGIKPGPNGEREETRGPLPDFSMLTLKGRKVLLAFDSNVVDNPKVRQARQALADFLTGEGAQVYLVQLPQYEGVNGPDDFIALRGDEAMLDMLEAAPPYVAITLYPGETPAAVDQAEEALLPHAQALRLFQRVGELVRIISLPELLAGGGLQRPVGTVQLEPISPVALTEIFDRIVRWQKINADGKARAVDCPSRIAIAYISRVGEWRIPILTGIISAPILRTDGTVLLQPGYDSKTGLFFATGEEWPEIPDEPTPEDARRALQEIAEPFHEFPFVSGSDRSVLIAAVLTAIQRRVLRAAPLFGFTAPSQRTGKSLLAEAVAIIATGRPAPATAVSTQREELRKAVTSTLLEGHLIVNLDNIEGPLASPDLARAITQAEYGDRVLGESRQLRLPTNVLWTATGNNLTLRGDLTSRTLLCRIDSGLEKPEERTFRITNLEAFLTENRKRLVAAALTILRAYQVAGRPHQLVPAWGGFGDWSSSIREPLIWLGCPDPCATREHVIADDPDREEATAVLTAWYKAFPGKMMTLRELLEAAETVPELRNALLAVSRDQKATDRPDAKKLGYWCRSWRSRVLDGLQLCSDKKRSKGGSRWWVAAAPNGVPRGADCDDGADVSVNRESFSGESTK